MQSNVNVDELNGVALEIAKSIQQLNQSISDFKETSNSIKGQCETLNGYNGQKVAGTTTKEQVYDDKGYSSTIETYKIWDIEGQVPLESDCNTLEQELDDMEESISNLKLEASDLELIADTIEGYIKSIQDELGEDIDPSILAGAFGVLEGGIAYDSYSAGTGNFISSKHILSEYWTDKTLRFERKSNGTYTIYQKDENGKEVAMGYTTALTAALYMKELKNKVQEQKNDVEMTITDKDGNVLYEGDRGGFTDNPNNPDVTITDKDGNVISENSESSTNEETPEMTVTDKDGNVLYEGQKGGFTNNPNNPDVNITDKDDNIISENSKSSTNEETPEMTITDKDGNVLYEGDKGGFTD